jgi:hypothetical protein
MKQTAVEWYHEEMESIEYRFRSREINFEKLRSLTKDALEKAKGMEKEQIMNAYNNGDNRSAELYYNETYESK